jgi:hypothetical protein
MRFVAGAVEAEQQQVVVQNVASLARREGDFNRGNDSLDRLLFLNLAANCCLS